LGLTGVLAALRLGTDGLVSWAGLAVLGSATCYALSAVLAHLSSRSGGGTALATFSITFQRKGLPKTSINHP